MKNTLTTLLLLTAFFAQAQVGIGVATGDMAPSAQLEVKSTTKGFLPPRMLASERVLIYSPTAGLLVFQTDAPVGLYYYTGSAWTIVNSASAGGSYLPLTGGTLTGDITVNGAYFGTKGVSSNIVIGDTPATNQGIEATAIGKNAGYDHQSNDGIAIGTSTGQYYQGLAAISIGTAAGTVYQGEKAITLGYLSGYDHQGASAIAIGNESGRSYQSSNTIALGNFSGKYSQGTNAIAIGQNAGVTSQHANSIVLNASGTTLDGNTNAGLYVDPVRNASGTSALFYDATTKEITYEPKGFGPVGIGTSTPAASAQLEVTSSSKGFLPPRVGLTGTGDVATISSPATGLFIYNTDTAGSSPSNVTPGLYYYDGSKWQRVINQQPDATIEFDKDTPTTASVVFSPNAPASKDYIYVSTTNNSQWTYNGTTYVTYNPPASTAWNLSGGTTDAGSNKTGSIYRSGKVGIGTNNPGAALEVSSGVSNSSGMKFTNINSTTPTSSGATLGVDASGNVVTVQGSSFTPSFGSSRIPTTINVPAGTSSLLTSINLPTTGTYLINYTMRAQNNSYINNQYAVGYLSNTSTPGTPIVGTEILGALISGSTVTGGNYSGSYVVTTTSANTSIYFIGAAQTGGISFVDDGNGRTQISFVKVTP